MAQTTQTTTRKTLSLPKTAANTRAALKQGLKTKPQDTPRHDEPPRANEQVWVNALAGAEGFHRDALQLELAVGLSVFSVKADAAKVPLDAKKALKDIYAKAGYACATPQGEDYKTVNRRINVAADLYQHIGGRETIVDWVGDASPRDQVKTIMEHVKNYKFDSINSVLAYMGKAVAVKRPRLEATQASEADQRVAEAAATALSIREVVSKFNLPEGHLFQHGAMTVVVPVEATYADVMAIVADLSVFAATKLRTPEPAANSEAQPQEQPVAA